MCSKLFIPPTPGLKNAPAIGVTEHYPPPELSTLQLSKVDIVILVIGICALLISIVWGRRREVGVI